MFLFQLIKLNPGPPFEPDPIGLTEVIKRTVGSFESIRAELNKKGWDFPNMDSVEGKAVAEKAVLDIKSGTAVIDHWSTTKGVATHPWSVISKP